MGHHVKSLATKLLGSSEYQCPYRIQHKPGDKDHTDQIHKEEPEYLSLVVDETERNTSRPSVSLKVPRSGWRSYDDLVASKEDGQLPPSTSKYRDSMHRYSQ